MHRLAFHSINEQPMVLEVQCVQKKLIGIGAKGAVSAFELHERRWFDAAFECQLAAGKPLIKTGSTDSGYFAE